MEFGEKLQELRKGKGLTQEELAEALFVSRTAVSKWETGRGYPNLDSLKEIANFFSVTLDELLSGEKLISIAERENASNIRTMCELLFGMADVGAFLLIVLPLYPKTVEGYVYSVNLFAYTEVSGVNRFAYWVLFLALILLGVWKLFLAHTKVENMQKTVTGCSIGFGIMAVFFLALAGEAYGVTVAFLLLLFKGQLLFRSGKRS